MIESHRPEDFEAAARAMGYPDGANAVHTLEAAGRLYDGGHLGTLDVEALQRAHPCYSAEGLRQFADEINSLPQGERFSKFVRTLAEIRL